MGREDAQLFCIIEERVSSNFIYFQMVTTSSFKLCFKELYSDNGYDAVTVTHVVLKG